MVAWRRWFLFWIITGMTIACEAPANRPAMVPITPSPTAIAALLPTEETKAADHTLFDRDDRKDEEAQATSVSSPVAKTNRPAAYSGDLTPREIVRGSGQSPAIALTFDCGASSRPTPRILETLEREGVIATFFVTGQWVEKNPDLLRKIAATHELGNHTVSHRDLTRLSAEEITAELQGVEVQVQALTGKTTQPFFRAPFGSRNERVLQAAAQAGLPLHVYWTVDSADWRADATAEGIYRRTVRLASAGAIVIFHCGSEATATALPEVIAALKERGLATVTVSQLLAAAEP